MTCALPILHTYTGVYTHWHKRTHTHTQPPIIRSYSEKRGLIVSATDCSDSLTQQTEKRRERERMRRETREREEKMNEEKGE